MGNRNHGSLLKKATVAGLACLLLVAGLPLPAAAAEESCKGWNTAKFFESATVDEVRACLSAGRDPNEVDRQGLTALHRAARDTSDPAVIEALLDAGANPRVSSRAGRLPRYYARKNKKIQGSDAWHRLMIVSVKKLKKADWSRVQSVPHNRKTVVRLYEDAAPPENRRIKGRFDSATAASITLRLKDGQTRIFQKSAVRKVLISRPFSKRKPGWITAGVASLIWGVLFVLDTSGGAEPGEVPQMLSMGIGVPTLIAFLVGKRGSIYNVPPKHLPLSQGDKQSGNQDNGSTKQEDPRD